MKIAVPTRDGRVDDHFGHCAYYTIFDVIDGKVVGVSKMASPEGCGCKSGIAPVLRQLELWSCWLEIWVRVPRMCLKLSVLRSSEAAVVM